jgi:hypothetical protein
MQDPMPGAIMTARPEITTTDFANLAAASVHAVLQRHAFTDGVVRHDVWLDNSQFTAEHCHSPADSLQLATVARRAEEVLSAAPGGRQ